jgi:hypothetical protein
VDLPPDTIAELRKILARDPGPEPELPTPVEAVPMPNFTQLVVTAPSAPGGKPKARARIFCAQRRGYMRATREEGIRDELRKMNDEARGTPFFHSALADGPKANLLERLAALKSRRMP